MLKLYRINYVNKILLMIIVQKNLQIFLKKETNITVLNIKNKFLGCV